VTDSECGFVYPNTRPIPTPSATANNPTTSCAAMFPSAAPAPRLSHSSYTSKANVLYVVYAPQKPVNSVSRNTT